MNPPLLTSTLLLIVWTVAACSGSERTWGCGGSDRPKRSQAPSHACFDPAKAEEAPPALGHKECGLESVWKACVSEDLDALHAISADKKVCPIERTLAAYAHYVLKPTPRPEALLAAMPTDLDSITWMREGYAYPDVYGDPQHLYNSLESVFMPLALQGDEEAIGLMVKGWIAYQDGAWGDIVCAGIASDLLKRQPRLTIEVAARERSDEITFCVAYRLHANDEWVPRIEQIRRMQFESPAAVQLRDDIVEAYYYDDPDWP
jgi:hypothetical protein